MKFDGSFTRILFLLTITWAFGGCQSEKTTGEKTEKEDSSDPEWVSLFDGQTLDGWKTMEGDVTFQVQDQMIVSESQLDVPNGYLCTERSYDNFILELEVKIDTVLNSGIQIRSQVWENDTTTQYLAGNGDLIETNWQAGIVWGYQIEVDPSSRAWTGGLYEPGNRGWLVTLIGKENARQAFKPLDWNRIRIEADGNRIRTWVNDIPAVDATDEVSSAGFIGLQFHEAYHDYQVGKKVYWRNIRLKEL